AAAGTEQIRHALPADAGLPEIADLPAAAGRVVIRDALVVYAAFVGVADNVAALQVRYALTVDAVLVDRAEHAVAVLIRDADAVEALLADAAFDAGAARVG